MAAIAERIRSLRSAENITQKQLSEATGIPLQSVINYENGRREPNAKALVALERFFGVSGEYLWGEVDREEYLRKGETVEGGLEGLVAAFQQFQAAFRIMDQDIQLAGVQAMETAVSYVNRQLASLPPSAAPLNDFTALVTAFARMDRDQAAELLRFAAATGQGSPRTDEETLAQKYRQLDRRGQAAVMETLQREYDYLFKPIEVPVAAMGGGKQKLVTTQADEDRLQRKLAETSPPDDL